VNAGDGRRTVLVTGASGGVGRGIALACGAAGWDVWIAARRAEEGGAVAAEVTGAGGRGRFVECDVGDVESVRAAIEEIVSGSGRLDGLVHNATSGLSSRAASMTDVSVADLEDHVRVSTRGCYLLARAAFPHLKSARGAFVVTTSEAGFDGKRLLAPYAMVKAQQRAFVGVLAREWGPDGIRVNAIAPLAGSPAMVKAFASDPSMEARVMGRIPLGRLGDAVHDIGVVARFLLGGDAGFVTGQTLMVDGGSCPV
jgi:3-oxoacyl-[acyl-carrier protein] reductase